jgi:outer membrane protein assembly factor BamB
LHLARGAEHLICETRGGPLPIPVFDGTRIAAMNPRYPRFFLLMLPGVLFIALASRAQGPSRSAEPAPAQAAADAWPQFRGTPELTGVSASNLPAELKLAWSFEAGEAIESSAAIADGAVFVGTQKGELLALDLATGKLRWRYATREPIGESSPAVAGGIVYVGDLGGTLHAVDAREGKAVWTVRTGSEIKSSPVVVEGRTIFGSYDEHLYAVNARTGAILWQFKTNGPVHATAGVRDGVAYISGCDGRFRGVRIANGAELFAVDSGGYTGASPALAGGMAFFGTYENEILGVDLALKRILWRYSNPKVNFPFYASAAMAGGRVIAGGRDKIVHALDAKSGKEVWSFAARARVDSSAAVAAGRVYVGSNDNRLYVLNLSDGKKLWEFDAGAPITASPAIAVGSLVIGTQDGRLLCFR